MAVLQLKRVEVTDAWGMEFIAANWSQGGSLNLITLPEVHFLGDRTGSLLKRRRIWKWFLTDQDRELE